MEGKDLWAEIEANFDKVITVKELIGELEKYNPDALVYPIIKAQLEIHSSVDVLTKKPFKMEAIGNIVGVEGVNHPNEISLIIDI